MIAWKSFTAYSIKSWEFSAVVCKRLLQEQGDEVASLFAMKVEDPTWHDQQARSLRGPMFGFSTHLKAGLNFSCNYLQQ
jgi:hypothetical protein